MPGKTAIISVVAVAPLVATYRWVSKTGDQLFIVALSSLLGLGLALEPIARVIRVRLALRRGRRAEAVVLSLRSSTPQFRGYDGWVNGWAEGVRLVHASPVPFEDEFSSD